MCRLLGMFGRHFHLFSLLVLEDFFDSITLIANADFFVAAVINDDLGDHPDGSLAKGDFVYFFYEGQELGNVPFNDGSHVIEAEGELGFGKFLLDFCDKVADTGTAGAEGDSGQLQQGHGLHVVKGEFVEGVGIVAVIINDIAEMGIAVQVNFGKMDADTLVLQADHLTLHG